MDYYTVHTQTVRERMNLHIAAGNQYETNDVNCYNWQTIEAYRTHRAQQKLSTTEQT